MKKWVSKLDSSMFFRIRKWASNPVLRRTFQLQSALENFLYIGNTCYKYAKVSLNVPYDKKGIEVIGAFTKKLYAKQKKQIPKNIPLVPLYQYAVNWQKWPQRDFFHKIRKSWKIVQIWRENIPKNRMTPNFPKLFDLLWLNM